MSMAASNADAIPQEEVKAKPKKKAPVVIGVVATVLAVGGGIWWLANRGKESTDDAFVEAHVANVAARVQGQVVKVNVQDNQQVKAGDVLVELDDRDAKVRLATSQATLLSAQANLTAAETQLALTEKNVDANLRTARGGVTQASAMLGTSSAGIAQAKADVDSAQSRVSLAKMELDRTQRLVNEKTISQAELDTRQAQYDQAIANLALAKAREDGARVGTTNAAGGIESAQGRLVAAQAGPEQIDAAKAAVGVAKARVAEAQAAVDAAQLNVSYTKIVANISGVVSRRSVEVGQTVDPARPLMALTELSDVWVVANFKEDQIAGMKNGAHATVEVDAFHGRKLNAHVESLAGGSGARFSLLPPDNASGNFTKVVQRIPVLIRLDDKPGDLVLRPGMSTAVTVRVDH